jgi:oligopeptide transport system substrate-binding protein
MIQEAFDMNGILNSKWTSKAKLSLKPFLNTEYFAILMQGNHSALANKQIRKAVNYAIDRKELVRYLKYNLVLPANKGFVSAGMPNYDTSFSGFDYNPELARKLVSEFVNYSQSPMQETLHEGKAIIDNKLKIEIHINNSFVEMAEFIENQLEKVGFDIEIKLHPADMMMQLATDGKLDFFRRSWMADYPDAENYFSCFYSKNSCPPNYTRFVNKEYDRLYEEVITETNIELRKKHYKKMEQILIEESPIVPIFYDQSIRLIQKNVTGLEQNVLNTLDLRRVKIVESIK